MTQGLKFIPAFLLCQPIQAPIDKTEFRFNESQVKKGLLKMNNSVLDYFTREKFNDKYDNAYNLLSKIKLKEFIVSLNNETTYSSSPDDVLQNLNFKEIVKLGKDAIPFILEEIQNKPSSLIWALNLITGRRITEKKVSVEEASRLWINWGKQIKLIG